MKIIAYLVESFEYYKAPAMLIGMPTCTFKCCREQGLPVAVCQNQPWASMPTVDLSNEFLIARYRNNSISSAIVFAGLEPLDSFDEVISFVRDFRKTYNDPVVIYTGYREDEVTQKIKELQEFPNIIVKFGRYVPGEKCHFDEVLGIELASSNQYAKQIS